MYFQGLMIKESQLSLEKDPKTGLRTPLLPGFEETGGGNYHPPKAVPLISLVGGE